MQVKISLRPAVPGDSKDISRIYNHYISNTVVTFEEDPVDSREMTKRMEKTKALSLPWIVAEKEGKIIGYAYASPWRTRAAYRYSCETSIYLDKQYSGRGAGTMLYRELLSLLIEKGYHTVYAVVSLPNPASERIHNNLGFKKVAHLSEVGFKMSRWLDVGYWELHIPLKN